MTRGKLVGALSYALENYAFHSAVEDVVGGRARPGSRMCSTMKAIFEDSMSAMKAAFENDVLPWAVFWSARWVRSTG